MASECVLSAEQINSACKSISNLSKDSRANEVNFQLAQNDIVIRLIDSLFGHYHTKGDFGEQSKNLNKKCLWLLYCAVSQKISPRGSRCGKNIGDLIVLEVEPDAEGDRGARQLLLSFPAAAFIFILRSSMGKNYLDYCSAKQRSFHNQSGRGKHLS